MLVKGWINPITFFGVDEGPYPIGRDLTFDDFIQYAALGTVSIEDLRKRYLEISKDTPRLQIAPAEPRILEKLIWPLRHAKSSFMFGNCLGTISLCGMVGEMVSMLVFDISNIQINGQPMSMVLQTQVFGSTFEKLSQERRVKVLAAYNVLTADQTKLFDDLRAIRRRYLHLWSQDHEALPADAIKAYRSAAELVLFVLGQEFKDGAIVLKPGIAEYLQRNGMYVPEQEA